MNFILCENCIYYYWVDFPICRSDCKAPQNMKATPIRMVSDKSPLKINKRNNCGWFQPIKRKPPKLNKPPRKP